MFLKQLSKYKSNYTARLFINNYIMEFNIYIYIYYKLEDMVRVQI